MVANMAAGMAAGMAADMATDRIPAGTMAVSTKAAGMRAPPVSICCALQLAARMPQACWKLRPQDH